MSIEISEKYLIAAEAWLYSVNEFTSLEVIRTEIRYLGDEFNSWLECEDYERMSYFDLLVGAAESS